MSETILRIDEVSIIEDRPDSWGRTTSRVPRDGYRVTTTEQVVDLLIDSDGQCCEKFGYLWTNERAEDFIGAVLLDVRADGEPIDGGKALDAEYANPYPDDRATMFVDLITDRGILQYIAYNEHNGYYAHMATVRSRQLSETESL